MEPTQQHYPPGTQENYSNFPSINLMMEKGKESEFPEGRGVPLCHGVIVQRNSIDNLSIL
jgi:hypothetical protein